MYEMVSPTPLFSLPGEGDDSGLKEEKELLIMTTRVKPRRVMTSEDMICFAHEKFTENPVRLLSVLGIRPAKEKTFCCVHCSSGRGPRGTGMRAFKGRDGELRFHCYACGKTMDPSIL